MTDGPHTSRSRPGRIRWILWLALFLSLGFNLGFLASRWLPPGSEEVSETAYKTTDKTADDTNDETAADAEVASRDDAAELTPRVPSRVPPWLERIVVRVADELELRGTERDRFFDLQREFFRRTLRARHQQRRHEAEVRRLLLSGRAERAEVEAALDRVMEAEREVERAFLDHYFSARELLEPAQMRRYQRFLGQLRRASQELGRRAGTPDGTPPRPRPDRPGPGP